MEFDDKHSRQDEGRSYKSKAEVQIARLLDRNRIKYKYEHPLAVVDRGKTRIWYPDFYLSDYAIIVEYFGINGNSGYDKRTEHKVEVYKQAGIEGLFLNESSLRGDWPKRIIGQIEDILKNRLDRFYNRQSSR